MNTFSPFALAAGLSLLFFAVPGCDSSKASSGDAKSAAAPSKDGLGSKKGTANSGSKKDAPPAKAEPEPKAEAKPDVVACDQRDFISEGDKKMGAAMGKEPKPKLLCMDYSGRDGSTSKAGCSQGTALPTPCPDDKVLATCTLSNGTVYKHYEGAVLNSAERSCKSLEGTYAKK